MSLNTAQLATLKTAILADPVLAAQPNTNVGNSVVAGALNAIAAPDFFVWRTSVEIDEIMRNGMDWTRVDNLTVGKARIWDWMTRLGSFNASKANIRAGIDAAWVGTAADLAVRATIYTHCKRQALVIEKILASGTGAIETPATLTREGPITPDEIEQARAS